MKLFFIAVLVIMAIKGAGYILCPKLIKRMSQLQMETPETQLIAYGWILVIVAFIAWMSYVRYMPL